ncbi:hypothetical protein GCM10010442_55350 [Kitasatospora kifunensis]
MIALVSNAVRIAGGDAVDSPRTRPWSSGIRSMGERSAKGQIGVIPGTGLGVSCYETSTFGWDRGSGTCANRRARVDYGHSPGIDARPNTGGYSRERDRGPRGQVQPG